MYILLSQVLRKSRATAPTRRLLLHEGHRTVQDGFQDEGDCEIPHRRNRVPWKVLLTLIQVRDQSHFLPELHRSSTSLWRETKPRKVSIAPYKRLSDSTKDA